MENIILNSLSAATGGILFAVTFILCALLVLAIKAIDVKTSSRIKKPSPHAEKEEGDGEKIYYVVKSKKSKSAQGEK